jgi:CBS domain-containing protein
MAGTRTSAGREESSMKVQDLMMWEVESCYPSSDLAEAAMIMWRKDCGFVPVVENPGNKVAGVITDRDICMATATQHKGPHDIRVGDVMSRELFTCAATDDARTAMQKMKEGRVRRLPVVDERGVLRGVVSLNDLACAAERTARAGTGLGYAEVMDVLRAVSTHRIEGALVARS